MHLLMCPPDYFTVSYEINAWMHIANRPDHTLAQQQWQALYQILVNEIGVQVSLVAPVDGLPDMVFTANAGIVQGTTFVPSRFRFPERQGEVAYFTQWFCDQEFSIRPIPDAIPGSFEGEGDALLYGGLLLAGYGHRTDATALNAISELFERNLVPLRLIDSRWYHLDTCLIPISPELLAYYPPAFDASANEILDLLPGEKILLTENDALNFGGNAIVVDRHIILNTGCDALVQDLRTRGYTVHQTPLSEFLKAGGSAKCLALVLSA